MYMEGRMLEFDSGGVGFLCTRSIGVQLPRPRLFGKWSRLVSLSAGVWQNALILPYFACLRSGRLLCFVGFSCFRLVYKDVLLRMRGFVVLNESCCSFSV